MTHQVKETGFPDAIYDSCVLRGVSNLPNFSRTRLRFLLKNGHVVDARYSIAHIVTITHRLWISLATDDQIYPAQVGC